MHPFYVLLALFAALSLVAFFFFMRWERRFFQAKGLGHPWFLVRLSTIPIAIITAALVVLPAQSTAGMEGLAVFYLLLMTAAPVFWFSSHWFVGRLAKPQMTFSASAHIAASPLAFVFVAALVAHRLQTPAWSLLRSMGIE